LFKPKSILALALSSTLIPSAALADVTPMDVWTLHQDMYKALGGALAANTSEADGTLSVTDVAGLFALPMGLGTVTVTMGSWDYIDNGDGTVTARFPDSLDIVLALAIPGQVEASAKMQVNSDNYDLIASGTPNDVTMTYDFPRQEGIISDFTATGPAMKHPDFAAFENAELAGSVVISGNKGTSRITRGDVMTITGDYLTETVSYDFTMTGAENEYATTLSGSGGLSSASTKVTLLPDGVSVMAIPQAFRDGLGLSLTSSAKDTTSTTIVTLNGEAFSTREETIGSSDFNVTMDQDGMRVDGIGTDYRIVTDELKLLLPTPVEISAARGEFAFQMPFMASETPQPFTFLMDMAGLEVVEDIWGLLDPAAILPRDPADLVVDVTGNVETLIDLFDVEAMTKMATTETSPFQIEDVTISSLVLSLAGAKLTGTGAFSFDNADMETFPGIPAPTGALDLELRGGNGLLDNLVAMGLLPEEQAMGARMMTGLFAKPGDGDDSLTSKIEVDGATGAISANGQRLQ